jgi:hypothetical protein
MKVSRNGKIIGDYSHQEILDLLAKGELLLTDYFWGEGMTDWLPLSQLPKTVNSSNSNPPSLPNKPMTPNKDNKNIEAGCVKTFCAIIGLFFFGLGFLAFFGDLLSNPNNILQQSTVTLWQIRDLLAMILGLLLTQLYYKNGGK